MDKKIDIEDFDKWLEDIQNNKQEDNIIIKRDENGDTLGDDQDELEIVKKLKLKVCPKNDRKPKAEQSNERDLQLSKFHREFGYYCPAVDIDFLLVEWIDGKPVALIEYKRFHTNYNPNDFVYKAIRSLADASSIPFYIVEYTNTLRNFKVFSRNDIGKEKIKELSLSNTRIKNDGDWITWYEYLTFLYKLKGYYVPQDIVDNLKKYFIENEEKLCGKKDKVTIKENEELELEIQKIIVKLQKEFDNDNISQFGCDLLNFLKQ